MRPWVIDALSNIDPVPQDMLEAICKKGTLTGSYVFGGFKEYSDIDIILPPNFEYKFDDFHPWFVYESGDYAEDDGYQSCYVRDKAGKIYNLLFVLDKETYKTWKKATRLMIHITKIKLGAKLVKHKQHRVQLFEILKDFIDYMDVPDHIPYSKHQTDLDDDIPF